MCALRGGPTWENSTEHICGSQVTTAEQPAAYLVYIMDQEM